MLRTFASDNNAPAAPEIVQALLRANDGDAVGYGHDALTERVLVRFREEFGQNSDTFFVFNGTGANVMALSTLLRPYEAVICPASAHLQTDECGAFERFTGCKVLAVPTADGKLRVDDLAPFVGTGRDEHHVQPRAISISQATEYGTLYTIDEIRALVEFAHKHHLYVHVDGARIANAAVALGKTIYEITGALGVDVLTFGGTKNGLMYGEAVVYFNSHVHHGAARFARKQTMQLASKMRYIAAQFEALLEEGRAYIYAANANAMAARLRDAVARIPAVTITRPVECNAIFAKIDRRLIEPLQHKYFFYVFDEALPEVRWMTHFATRPQDVDDFAAAIASLTSSATPAG
jgi:threonine aldolase